MSSTIRYSKTTGAFYPLELSYSAASLPNDVVEVPMELYRQAMARQVGYTFDITDGVLTISEPAAPSERAVTLAKIVELEQTVTPRRMREAALNMDNGWLKALDTQIAALRATLA